MILSDLPLDVLEHLCLYLDAYSAVACSRVCRLLYNVSTISLAARYTVLLAMRGMRDGGNSSISLAEKLERLERYETAWHEGS